jgi:hypothetical protein
MEIVVAILVFIAVLVVAGLIFGGWVIVAVLRLLGRLIGGGSRTAGPPVRLPPPLRGVQCPHGNCRAANGPSARFCRRCGRLLDGYSPRAAPAVVRRVAMW